jgi:hypothetical protein
LAAEAEVFLSKVTIETVTATVIGNNGIGIEIEIATSGTLGMDPIIAANQIAIGAGGTVTLIRETPGADLAAPVPPREIFVTAMAATSRGCVAILGIAWCQPHQIQRMVHLQESGILHGGLLTEPVVAETGKEGGVVVEVPTWIGIETGTATVTVTATGTETFGIAIANGTEIESIIGIATLTVAIALIGERTTDASTGMIVTGRWTCRSGIGRQIEMKATTCRPSPPRPPLPPPLRLLTP